MTVPKALFLVWSDTFYSDGVSRSGRIFIGDNLDLFISRHAATTAANYRNEHGLGCGAKDWRVIRYGKSRRLAESEGRDDE